MNNVLSSRAIVYRNLKDFKFVPKLTQNNMQEIVNVLEQHLKGKMGGLNLNQADGNVVKHLANNNLILSGTQSLFVSNKDNVSINLFNGEHLAIISSSTGFDRNLIMKASTYSQMLENKITFSFSDEFGYLTSDLNKIGSGLMIECEIMLSAITKINKIEQVRQNVAKLGYSLKETKYPAVYILSTRCNLGISEKKVYEDFENTLTKLQELEIESVKMLDATNHYEMMDKASRSMAILNSSYLLTYDELYNIIVNLRMGLNLGIINIKVETLNKLQKLVTDKINELITPTEMRELCEKTKEILKGENNV